MMSKVGTLNIDKPTEDTSHEVEEYTRYTMFASMKEGLGDKAFEATFGCLDYDGFNKYIDKAILMNEFKNIGGE